MTPRFLANAALQIVALFIAVGMVQAAEPVSSRSYTVQRGDTLDRVIQKTMAASPLKLELLRQAYVDGNPQAFVSGNVSRLRAGAVLHVPDHTKLLRSVVLPVLEGADAAAVAGDGRPYNANASDRRSWVRFP
jgi:Tfp pilus assembly protein FimV